MNFASWNAKWIWTENPNENDSYADFLGHFTLENVPQEAIFRVSADTDYALWINGSFVDAGHYDDYPENRTYDELSVAQYLKTGKNTVALMGYYQGTGTFQYAPGVPGVLFVLTAGEKVLLRSDEKILARKDRVFRGNVSPLITPQLGYTFAADARGEDGWREKEERTAQDWTNAEVKTGTLYGLELRPRPVKKLVLRDRICPEIVAQGEFMHRFPVAKTAAERVQTDFLSPVERETMFLSGLRKLPYATEIVLGKEPVRIHTDTVSGADGFYLVLDLGREEAGLLELDVEAPAGTAIDVAWGQHLEDLRVRANVGGRYFAGQLLTAFGRTKFFHPFRRLGGRYLQLHVSSPAKNAPIVLHYAGVRPWDYPIEERGSFSCEDSLHERIWEVSRRTLELCMHEHYEDTTWREQAFYVSDSRNQALCGYYAFGEYDFPEACFGLYKDAFEEPMRSDLCAPCHSGLCIPSFTLTWPAAIREHWMYSGRTSLIILCKDRLTELANTILDKIGADGLLECSGEVGMWNFYEWSDGMGGGNWSVKQTVTRKELPFQLLSIRALRFTAEMMEAIGETEGTQRWRNAAEKLSEKAHKLFWDAERGLYASFREEDGTLSHWAQLTQALALCTEIVPEENAESLRERLLNDQELVPCTLSYSMYKYDALAAGGDAYGEAIFREVAKDWGKMLYHGATSFWETILGQKDFSNAGSLCHGWSAVPLYLYMRYALGVKPEKPGFAEYSVNPIGNLNAEGEVPTPFGSIKVRIRDGKAAVERIVR